MLKILSTTLALVLVELFAAGCGTDHAQMRLVHASPDAPNVDVLVDGSTLATNLAFGSVTNGYSTVNAGNRLVELRATGTTTDLVNAPNVVFNTHKQYTVFFTGLVTATPPTQTINPVFDDDSPPPGGNIKLRMFNAVALIPPAPPTPPPPPCILDFYVVAPRTNIANLSPNIASLDFQQASGYLSLAAASYEVIVTATGDGTKFRLVDQNYNLTAGQIRTLVILDVPGGGATCGGAISGTPLVLADLN